MRNGDATDLERIRTRFESAGGRFFTPVKDIASKVRDCRALVFDWDGVWNAGRKGPSTASDFSEADSMGVNMLRYGFWRRDNELPLTAIISGESNEGAIRFAEREHIHDVYSGVADKRRVIEYICERDDFRAEQIACVFDDVNDLPMAKRCGVRLMVRRDSSPMLADYVVRHSLCDYVTGSAQYAVRESCELLLGLIGNFDQVLDSRVAWDNDYGEYFGARQAIATRCFQLSDDTVVERGH